jgi:hypothetical protein
MAILILAGSIVLIIAVFALVAVPITHTKAARIRFSQERILMYPTATDMQLAKWNIRNIRRVLHVI